jgi:membrane protein DedA with SNARE-associated domain
VTDSWPYAAAFAFFFALALARSTATYWAGRGLRAGGERTRWARHLDRPAVVRAERFVRRVGAPAVTLSFLTVGVQTAVIAAAGALRMPLARFLPAAVVGALVWAALYTTVGFAVVEARVAGSAGPWLVLVVALAALVWAVTAVVRRRAVTGADTPAEDAADDPAA